MLTRARRASQGERSARSPRARLIRLRGWLFLGSRRGRRGGSRRGRSRGLRRPRDVGHRSLPEERGIARHTQALSAAATAELDAVGQGGDAEHAQLNPPPQRVLRILSDLGMTPGVTARAFPLAHTCTFAHIWHHRGDRGALPVERRCHRGGGAFRYTRCRARSREPVHADASGCRRGRCSRSAP